MLRPIGVMPDQLAYLHFVSLTILNALKRLPDLYLQDFNVRKIVPLTPPEEKWLWDGWGPGHRELNPVLGRLDAVVEFTVPMWKDSLRFMEPNLCGVGGIHWARLRTTAGRRGAAGAANCRPAVANGGRPGLSRDLHPGTAGSPASDRATGQNVCFVEPKYAGQGTDEQEVLAEYYRQRHGLTIVHADPCELAVQGGEVYYEDTRVDIAYRDYEIRDLAQLEADGVNVDALRLLFRENRIVSSLAGDFDHKSCWELLTDPQYTQKYFTAEERQIFRRHILWTRLSATGKRCCRTVRRGTCWNSSAITMRSWCSSRIARTAATG